MAFAQASPRQDALSTINITPLIDVMLVLLVIFMIAAPVLTRDIPLDLPRQSDGPPPPPPIALELRIDAAGQIELAGQPMPASALMSVLSAERERAQGAPLRLDIVASDSVDYQVVARTLAAARDAGLERIRIL